MPVPRCANLALLFLTLLSASPLAAVPGEESAPSSEAAKPSPAPPGEVREVEPKLYYLKDKDGKLVLVPDFSFEHYEQLIALEIARKTQQPPQYSYADLVQVTGTANEDQATLEAVIPLRLTQVQPGGANEWVRVPLRLNQGILVSPPKHQGDGDYFLEFQRDGDGYVAWVRSKSAVPHRLTLNLKVPLARTGGETRLSLMTARTPTRLRLELPGGQIEGRVSNSEENVLTTGRTGDQSTVFTVDSAGGNFDLSWRQRDETPPMLEATGTVLVTIDRKRVECDARLKVRSYGAPIDSFLVRLPPGMELAAFNQPGFRVTPVAEASGGGSRAEGQRLLVKRLDGKTANPLDVRLVAWRPPELEKTRSQIDVAGFEVLGAVRQSGSVDFAAEGEWQVDFLGDQHVHRVEETADAARSQSILARFEYFRQPYSLKVDLIPKQARVSVEPSYVFQVAPQRIRLDATLRCRMRGVRAKDVKIDLGGWVVDRVSPQEFVAGPVATDKLTPLQIPLSGAAQSGSGEFELRVEAHRDVDAKQQTLSLTAPRCQESVTSPALVVVAPADNVELTPQTESLKGLVPETLPASVSVPRGQQPALVYREEPTAESSVFVARFRRRPRSVAVQVNSVVRVQQDRVQVEQNLVCQVSYEALGQLVLEVPRWLAQSRSLRVTRDAKDLRTSVLPGDTGQAEAGRARVGVELPEACIGQFTLNVQYDVPPLDSRRNWLGTVRVPLVQTASDETTTVAKNSVQILVKETLSVELDDDQWSLDAEQTYPESAAGTMRVAAEGRRDQIGLIVTLAQPRQAWTTVIRKAWLQVWVAGNNRRDRACFRLASNRSRLEVQLPPYAHAEGVEVWLSGKPLTDFTVTKTRRVQIPLGEGGATRELTLELFYWFTMLDPPVGRLTVEAPTVVDAARASRLYWQLVLPKNEHLLWSSERLTRELVWQWGGFFWNREDRLTPRSLEDWVSASAQEPLPVETNRYLFSSVGSFEPCVFVSAKRHIVVLVLSGIALGLGVLLLYVSRLRHPATALCAGIALASVGLIYPDPTILAAQAAAVGIALAIVARLLEWIVSRRRYQRAAAYGAVYPKSDSRTGGSPVRQGEGSSKLGTTSHFPVTVADPQP